MKTNQEALLEATKEKSVRLVFLGSGGVGKTSFLKKLSMDRFDDDYDSSGNLLQVDFRATTNKGTVKIEVVEYGGQQVGDVMKGTEIGADAGMIMWDARMTSSVRSLRTWQNNLVSHCGGDRKACFVVVCNKVEDQETYIKWAKNFRTFDEIDECLKHFRISIKQGVNPGHLPSEIPKRKMRSAARHFSHLVKPLSKGEIYVVGPNDDLKDPICMLLKKVMNDDGLEIEKLDLYEGSEVPWTA